MYDHPSNFVPVAADNVSRSSIKQVNFSCQANKSWPVCKLELTVHFEDWEEGYTKVSNEQNNISIRFAEDSGFRTGFENSGHYAGVTRLQWQATRFQDISIKFRMLTGVEEWGNFGSILQKGLLSGEC
jgi:hypothetical protein